VLANERLAKPQPVGEDDCFPVLAENVTVAASRWMNRLREEAESHVHGILLIRGVHPAEIPNDEAPTRLAPTGALRTGFSRR
jgi:hypothetical protein